MDSGERELEDDLRRAIAEAVAASRPVADELIDVIKHVRSELCSAGEGLTPSAEESTRELLDAAQGICREIGAQLDDVLHVQLREINTFNIVLLGRTGTGKSSLIEAISRGNGESISPGEGDYTTGICSLEWASCRLYDTPGIQGWTSGSRLDLEELARRAVTIADLVLICFDGQNQQAGEFRKVAEWVSASGKPAVAVLNCRNPVWRVPPKTGQRSERVQLSRPTREHAGYIRDQLECIGLPDVPVVAVHTLHAFLATATEPLAGKAVADLEPQLRAKRARYGAARLWQWSNVPALESLIIEALRRDAVALRLGRLVQQVRGTLTGVGQRWEDVGALAEAGAESVERGIEQQLAVLGTGEVDALDADTTPDRFDQLREAISKLEELRGRPLDAPARGSLALHAKNVISATVSELRSAARRRADEAIDEARNQRRVLSPEEFDRRVFDQAAVNNAVQEIAEELSTYLDKRLTLVAEDLAADLHRVVVRGQAGSLLRPAATWVRGPASSRVARYSSPRVL